MSNPISSSRLRGAALLATGAVASLAIAAAGCSSEDSAGGDPGPVAAMAPDRTTWDATYRSDATVLDAETVAAKLKNPLATDGVYRFDASVGDVVAGLPPGRALLLSGVDVVRVKSVTTEGAEIVVETEPASLPDVVKDGEASWDVGVDFAAPSPSSVGPCRPTGSACSPPPPRRRS